MDSILAAIKKYSTIPRILWHGTPDPEGRRAPSILAQGLTGFADYHPQPSVYLALDRAMAEDFADSEGGRGAVFQIDASQLDPSLIEDDEWDPANAGMSIAYRGNIPASAITQVPR